MAFCQWHLAFIAWSFIGCVSETFIIAALWNMAGHYIFALWFLLSSSFFLPRLIWAFADWMSTAISDFWGFEILTFRTLTWATMRNRAKFGRNRSNHCQNMAIFRFFFKMAIVRRFRFVTHVFEQPTKSIWWSLSLCKIWLESVLQFWRYVSFHIMPVWL